MKQVSLLALLCSAFCLFHVGLFLGSFFYREEHGEIFLLNVGWLFLTGHTALYHRK
jgi:hypothetical protein